MSSTHPRVVRTPAVDPMMGQLEVIEPGLALYHAFANVSFAYGDGEMLVADTSSAAMGAMAVQAIRKVTDEPVTFIVYTHGHGDHAFGTRAFIDDAVSRGHTRPRVWAHEDVPARFSRYTMTRGWQRHINMLQFGISLPLDALFAENSFHPPDLTYREMQLLELASEPVELHHALGETDDATWVWLPRRRAAMVGDLIVSSLPNTGNPNKVQRYTLEWAQALEAIARRNPNYVMPGHGPVYRGSECDEVLRQTARALRFIHDEVLRRLNAGQWPIDIIEANIELPDELRAKRYLAPIYGCTPFVVRDVIRRYAGWWTGEPSQMFPARRTEHANDVLNLCGRDELMTRARELASGGELKRALALAELAVNADATDGEAIELNAEVLDKLAAGEPSFIARNFYLGAARELRARMTQGG